MNLYLDTNVYSLIDARREARRVRAFLDLSGHEVLITEDHLAEILDIENSYKRSREMRCLTTVGSTKSYCRYPDSYRHAAEVLGEVRRLRPQWLSTYPDTSMIEVYLNNHRQKWVAFGRDPGLVPRGVTVAAADMQAVYGENRESHKSLRDMFRRFLRTRKQEDEPSLGLAHPDFADTKDTFDNPEVVWRLEMTSAWTTAIIQRNPASRDYLDWVAPYLRGGEMDIGDWMTFWLREIDGDRVPRNRLVGLVHFYQASLPKQKWGHGNPFDALHAPRLLDCDLFVTADERFYDVLRAVREHYAAAGAVALVDGAAPSALAELRAACEVAANDQPAGRT